MKPLRTLLTFGLGGAMVGGLVATNPDPVAYEAYALAQANQYLGPDRCQDLPPPINQFLGAQCREAITLLQPAIPELVRNRTERMNWHLFSLYRTTLGVPELAFLPTYQFTTLAIAGQFIPLQAQQTQP